MAKGYVLEDKEKGLVEDYRTLKELSEALGQKVTKKDVLAGKVDGVSFVDDLEEDTESDEKGAIEEWEERFRQDYKDTAKAVEDASNEVEDSDDVEPPEPTDAGHFTPYDDANENPNLESGIEFPEVGEFKEVKAIKKYIKGLSDEELYEWCELEGATWKHNDNPSINRMRAAMAIKAIHFPETKQGNGSKKKSKYSDYTTEELVKLALEHDVPVRDAKGDPRIERMYVIMALRQVGLLG